MPRNNPRIVFVSSLLTSKIFWTQILGAAATIATAFGVHPQFLSTESQVEFVGTLTMLATVGFRLWGYGGPVSLTAPISPQPDQELPPGTHTITVAQVVTPTPPPVATITSAPLGAPNAGAL